MSNSASPLTISQQVQAINDADAQMVDAALEGDVQAFSDAVSNLAHARGAVKMALAYPATSLSADTPPAAPWTPNSTEQSMLREVAKTTDDPAQFASIMKEKVATFRAESSGSDDMFTGSPYDQAPEKLDQYLTDQFESTKLSLNTELADQEARAVK